MTTRDTHTQTESVTDTDALWTRQERLRKSAADGEAVPVVDRALYAALARMQLPPPDDLAASTAAIVTRAAEARQRVARFRRASIRLFALLYLPAIIAAGLLFASDLPEIWLRAAPAQRMPLEWLAVIAVLATTSALLPRRPRREPV